MIAIKFISTADDAPLHQRFLNWLATNPPGIDRPTAYLVELPAGGGLIGDRHTVHIEFSTAGGALAAMNVWGEHNATAN